MTVSRDTAHRYKETVERNSVAALIEKCRRKPNRKNCIDQKIEQAALEYALEWPSYLQLRASNVLIRRGIFVSSSDVCDA